MVPRVLFLILTVLFTWLVSNNQRYNIVQNRKTKPILRYSEKRNRERNRLSRKPEKNEN